MTKTFTVNLLELATPFEMWCSAHGVTRSTAIRQLVGAAVKAKHGRVAEAPVGLACGGEPYSARIEQGAARPVRFTIQLSSAEAEQLRIRSAQTGLPSGRYLAAAMVADCRRSSVADKVAVGTLRDSCIHLAELNRYLRRTRRTEGAAQGSERRPTTVPPVDLRAITEQVEVHLESAAAVLGQLDPSVGRHKSVKLPATGGKAEA